MNENGIVYFRSFHEVIRPLPDAERLILYDAILDYGLDGTEPQNLPPILRGYFVLIRPVLNSSNRKYHASIENGKKGGRPPKKPSRNPAETQDKPVSEPSKKEDKDKESNKESEKEVENVGTSATVKPSRSHFIPPSISEVQEYCRDRRNDVDAGRWFDYYTANGWMVGKNRMKDWKAAIRTWEHKPAVKTAGENWGWGNG